MTRGPRATMVASLLAVLLVVSLALVVVVLHRARSATTPDARQDDCSRRAERVRAGSAPIVMQSSVFDVPAGWYSVAVCFTTAAMVQPLGYLTTQHPVAQCRPVSEGGGCGAPTDRLGPDGGLVVLSTAYGPRSDVPFPTTLGGDPARVRIRHHVRVGRGERCDVAVDAWIRLDREHQVWASACLNGAQAGRLGSLMTMLRTAAYRG